MRNHSCLKERKDKPKCPICGYAAIYVCYKCIAFFRDPRLEDEDQTCSKGGVHEERESGRLTSPCPTCGRV